MEKEKKIKISEIISKFQEIIPKGRNFTGICPFHKDKSPSLNISNEKNIFKCFVCGAGGNATRYVSKLKNVDNFKAREIIYNKLGIQFNKKRIIHYNEDQLKSLNIINKINNLFMYYLYIEKENNAQLKDFITKRDLNIELIEKFELGFIPNHYNFDFLEIDNHELKKLGIINEKNYPSLKYRLTIPIKDIEGNIISFSGRKIKDNDFPKYLHSINTNIFKKSDVLYNLNNALLKIKEKKELIIVEGFFDVISLYKIGIENVIATLGSFLSVELLLKKISYLKNKKIIIALDSDEAGKNATLKLILSLLRINKNIFVLTNKEGLDPDDFVKKYGEEHVKKELENSIHWFKFVISNFYSNDIKDSIEKINVFFKNIKPFSYFLNIIEKEFFAKTLEKILNLEYKTIFYML